MGKMTSSLRKADFEGEYISVPEGEQKRLVLGVPVQETRSYDDGKTERIVAVFPVLKIDGAEVVGQDKKFVTGAKSFIDEIWPVLERADRAGKEAVDIIVKYSKEKRYSVVDMGGQ